jgi:MarR family transcriptional regulator, 2-MHQ and catechol-resistance regulon repressor
MAQAFRSSCGFLLQTGCTSAFVLLVLATSWVQGQSTSTGNSIQKDKPVSSGAGQVTSKEVSGPTAAPPQPPPKVGQDPTRPPTVAWDGKQLTIDTDNSTLADILNAVRAQTGASIEMPSTASLERVFVHLGPGPPRDILSSLVYGAPFDYVIETADDPDTLRKVVLTAQGLGDGDVVTAGAADTADGTTLVGSTLHRGGGDGHARPGVRMMPGWAGPGMPSFQADAEATLETQRAAQDAAAPQDSAVAQDSAGVQDSAVVQDSSAQESAASKEDSAGAAAAEGARASNASPSTADSSDTSGIGQAMQSMTQMFEQRRQIQSQQNQTSRQQKSPAD